MVSKKNKYYKNKTCKKFTNSQYYNFLKSINLYNRIPDSYSKSGLFNNLEKWNNKTRKLYKKFRENFNMKPFSKLWNKYRFESQCNVENRIKNNVKIPVIGILSMPTGENILQATSYIPQTYVKWIEMQGAKVVPIQYDLPLQMINLILSQINGVLFIGGEIERNLVENNYYNYLAAMNYIVKKVMEQNINGNTFPIWSTCLGFELLPLMTMDLTLQQQSDAFLNDGMISEFKHYGRSNFKFNKLTKEEIDTTISTPLQNEFTKKEKNTFEKGKNIMYIHDKSFLLDKEYTKEFKKFLNVVAYTKHNNKKYISMYQYKSFPFYGVQFHPEVSIFAHYSNEIPHNREAIEFSQKLSSIFINECKKNYNIHIFGLNDDDNIFIKNYNLLSKENVFKILFQNKINAELYQLLFDAAYYFGNIDYIDSKYIDYKLNYIPSIKKTIKYNNKKKRKNLLKQKK